MAAASACVGAVLRIEDRAHSEPSDVIPVRLLRCTQKLVRRCIFPVPCRLLLA